MKINAIAVDALSALAIDCFITYQWLRNKDINNYFRPNISNTGTIKYVR